MLCARSMRDALMTSTRNTAKLPPKMLHQHQRVTNFHTKENRIPFVCIYSRTNGEIHEKIFLVSEPSQVCLCFTNLPLAHSPARGREAVRASNSPELDETKRDGTRRHQVRLEPERLNPAAAPRPTVATGFPRSFMTATHTARTRPVRRNRHSAEAREARRRRDACAFSRPCRLDASARENRPRRAPSSCPR